MIQHIKDWFRGYPLGGRSSLWSTARKLYITAHPNCELCGTDKSLEVHHATPVSVDKSKELDPDNFVVLCGWRGNSCHFIFGHLFSFHSYNKNIKQDIKIWKEKLKNRP